MCTFANRQEGTMALSITTLSIIMTLSIMGLFPTLNTMTLSINDTLHNNIALSAIMLSVVMLSVVMLSVVMLSVVMLSFILLSVSFNLLLCWMSLCWVSLCWMSWHRQDNFLTTFQKATAVEQLGATTLSIMTLSIMTFSTMTLSIMTFSITINNWRYLAQRHSS